MHMFGPLEKYLETTFRSLKYRNYRLYFMGQGLSLIGTWMQRTAIAWLVYRLTDSPLILGINGFFGTLPVFLFSNLAGALADRWDRHRALMITQFLAMCQAIVLAALTITGLIQVWHIFVLAFTLGLINTFDQPNRQSLVFHLVDDKEDLSNVIALNSSIFNSARLIGPAVAGVLIGVWGEGVCMFINALSFIATLSMLAMLRLDIPRSEEPPQPIWSEMKAGFRYVHGFPPIRDMIIFQGVVLGLSVPYFSFLPVIARDVLLGGPSTYGLLVTSTGCGALVGAFWLASRPSVLGLERVLTSAVMLFGLAMLALSNSTIMALSMCFMFAAGMGIMTINSSINTLLQTMAEEQMRGRVLGLYYLAMIGTAPLGNLAAGLLARFIGAVNVIWVFGVLILAALALFNRRLPALRRLAIPVLAEKGILPQMMRGIDTANEVANLRR